jgi:hypothetical protein
MLCHRFVTASILVLTTRLMAAEPVVPADGLAVDQVWSGHPVGFAMVASNDHQFIAYYDRERRLTVAARALDQRTWTIVHPEGVPWKNRKGRLSTVTEWDSHNYLRLALDRNGDLHLSGNLHNDPLLYYRTRTPGDITTLERLDRMTGVRENRATYPVFFTNAEGDLLFRYRDGGSGNGSDIYNRYDTTTHTWSRLLDTPLMDGQGKRNAYASEPVLGPDGRFHLIWMWRETPDCATNHTLSYARSRDLLHWEDSHGRPIALPITLATGDVIDRAKPGDGLINMSFNLGFDAQGKPLVVYHRYDAHRHSQAYLARPTDGPDWQSGRLSDWTFTWAFAGGGSIAAEVVLGRPRLGHDGSLSVDFATTTAGDGRWLIDPVALTTTATRPAPPAALPATLATAIGLGMEVQSLSLQAGEHRWVLRWETLPRNRDLPRSEIPAATELRLYEFPASDITDAARIGS